MFLFQQFVYLELFSHIHIDTSFALARRNNIYDIYACICML